MLLSHRLRPNEGRWPANNKRWRSTYIYDERRCVLGGPSSIAHWGMKRRRRKRKKKIKETYWECTVNGFCSYILYRIRRAFDVICTFQCTSGSRPMALLIISDSKTDRKKKKPRDKRERESPVWQEGLDVISSMTVLPHPPSSFTTFCSARLLERRWACPGPSCADEWTIS